MRTAVQMLRLSPAEPGAQLQATGALRMSLAREAALGVSIAHFLSATVPFLPLPVFLPRHSSQDLETNSN